MRPNSAVYDVENCPLGYVILTCQADKARLTSGVLRSNGDYLDISQLGPMVVFTSARPTRCAALRHHIGYVHFCRTEKQVIGADATRIVAMMTNIKRRIKWAIVPFVRQAMSAKYFRWTRAGVNYAVAAIGCRACPQPTVISFLDIHPKTFIEWCRFMWHIAMITHHALLYKRVFYGAF